MRNVAINLRFFFQQFPYNTLQQAELIVLFDFVDILCFNDSMVSVQTAFTPNTWDSNLYLTFCTITRGAVDDKVFAKC